MLPESDRSTTPTAIHDSAITTPVSPPQPRYIHKVLLGHIWPIILLLFLVAISCGLIWQHNYASDWLVIRGYHPTTTIQQLAADDTMTAYGKRLFYVDKPELEGKSAFNQHCTNSYDQVTVLGCYTGNRQGIYLYEISDPRLAGVEQVTAAHEMLHQAYERLSNSERANIDTLMTNYFDTTGPAMHAEMASYQKIEPNSVMDEMHSVFGTEVSSLPPSLEQYFGQYFTDRQKIVSYFGQYQAAFTQRQQQISSYDNQITTLNTQITADKAAIANYEQSLTAEQQKMSTYQTSNDITDYNADVPGFNAQVRGYTTLVSQTNALIKQYNSLVTARNVIATQEQQLEQAINSQTSTVTTQ